MSNTPLRTSVIDTMDTRLAFDIAAMEAQADEASRLLKALANPQRLRVLCLLVGSELTVGQINERLPELSQSALSQHLARLREEGLVQTRRESQNVWYSLTGGPAQTIINTLYGIYCAPEPRSRTRASRRRISAPGIS